MSHPLYLCALSKLPVREISSRRRLIGFWIVLSTRGVPYHTIRTIPRLLFVLDHALMIKEEINNKKSWLSREQRKTAYLIICMTKTMIYYYLIIFYCHHNQLDTKDLKKRRAEQGQLLHQILFSDPTHHVGMEIIGYSIPLVDYCMFHQ